MNAVADVCKKERHHPEWTNVYNRTHVRWTTHNPEGLSSKDVIMASVCDAAAEEKGEVKQEEAGGASRLEEIGARLEGGECCGGGEKKES